MSTRNNIKDIFLYLLSIKNLNQKIIKDVTKYNKVLWEVELNNKKHCNLDKNNDEAWLEVNSSCETLYKDLFKIYTSLEKNSEDLEIVWGHGLLSFKVKDEKITHHIFTTKMSLDFDAERAAFIIKPYNNVTNLEIGILEGLDLPNLDKILELNKKINELGIDPRNIDDIENTLKEIAHYLSAEVAEDNEVKKELTSISKIEITNFPSFYNAPALILRNIDTKLWDSELKDTLKYIDEGKTIPKTIEALVKNDGVIENMESSKEWEAVGKNILFPLIANEQQEEITRRLANNFGVVVQGPPGTGKSHTIANLICHLVAHGNRVLVTSQTDKALKVLSDKIPEEIRALCISILGNDAKALKELDEAVRKITENLSLDPEVLLKETAPLEEQLKLSREKQHNLLTLLKEAEMLENREVKFKTENYKLVDLAKWVKENKHKYLWMEDEIIVKSKAPLTEEEFERLIKLLNSNDKNNFETLNEVKSYIHKLPTFEALEEKLQKLAALESNINQYRANISNWQIGENTFKDNENLFNLVIKAKDKLGELNNSWFKSIMKYYYSNDASRDFWKDTAKNLDEYIKQINEIKLKINSHNFELPQNVDLNKLEKDFGLIYHTLKNKGRIGTIFKMLNGQYKYIFENLRVDYAYVTTIEQAELVKFYIEKSLLERSMRNLWNNAVREYGGRILTSSDSNLLINISESIRKIETITNWETEYKNKIEALLKDIKFPAELDLYTEESYDYLERGILSIRQLNEYTQLTEYIQNASALLLKNKSLEEGAMWLVEKDIDKLRSFYVYIQKLKNMEGEVKEISYLLEKLKAICPLFVEKLNEEWKNGSISSEYKNWDEMWKWKIAAAVLNEVMETSLDETERNIEFEKMNEKQLIKEIVARKTWYNQIIRTTEAQKRSLFTWMEAIKRIGKGSGKQAAKYRKIAQLEMEKCKSVIPVWIMPLNRVIENIKLEEDLFDVVIFDESSQSDISAISALLRGRRAVIVGDEKQISPEAVGKDGEMVENLINRFLKNIPHKEWFDLKTSLYNTALRVFPSRMVLKEHFRCAPEIIGFSNEMFYSDEIIPLRCPNKKETFKPSVKAIKVEEGLRDDNKPVNLKEAEALVDKIVECCNDEKYRGMTMGVISLLGEAQGELIENMLREKLGIEEIINRKLICGDAYSFQGDERDIMFLSMVIGKNAKFMSLTKESDMRRFNVAASRARNEMWLFHSVDLEDLNPKCMRAALLSYCIDPARNNLEYAEGEYLLNEGLKKDLYKHIKNLGYSIKCDVKVGKYRIDFVIEGETSRLALECIKTNEKGSSWYEENINKRMALKRVGWNFFVIRESEFYYNPEKTIEKLCKVLKEMGI